MSEKHYLFIFQDNIYYDVCATNIKNAVKEVALYYGEASKIFLKCISGYNDDDIEGLIELYNHFAYTSISKVYVIEDVLYSD